MTTPDEATLYQALRSSPSQLKRLRRLTYRCEQRCLILDSIRVNPGTVLMHYEAWKYSPEANIRLSNEFGRARSTRDGNRRWRGQDFYAGEERTEPSDHPGIQLSCDHVGVLSDGSQLFLSLDDFYADWHSGHTEMRVRRDGTRYALH